MRPGRLGGSWGDPGERSEVNGTCNEIREGLGRRVELAGAGFGRRRENRHFRRENWKTERREKDLHKQKRLGKDLCLTNVLSQKEVNVVKKHFRRNQKKSN